MNYPYVGTFRGYKVLFTAPKTGFQLSSNQHPNTPVPFLQKDWCEQNFKPIPA